MLHVLAKISKVSFRRLYSSPFVEALSLALPNPSMRVSYEYKNYIRAFKESFNESAVRRLRRLPTTTKTA